MRLFIYKKIPSWILFFPLVILIIPLSGCNQNYRLGYIKPKVIVIGFDLVPETLGMVKEGAVKITCGQYPYKQGYLPVKALYEYVVNGVEPESVDVGAEYVDSTNIDEYLE